MFYMLFGDLSIEKRTLFKVCLIFFLFFILFFYLCGWSQYRDVFFASKGLISNVNSMAWYFLIMIEVLVCQKLAY